MFVQAFYESCGVFVSKGSILFKELVKVFFNLPGFPDVIRVSHRGFLGFQDDCLFQNFRDFDSKRKDGCFSTFAHVLEIFEEMGEAFLFDPILHGFNIINVKAVTNEDSFKCFSKDVKNDLMCTRTFSRSDGING